MYIVLPEEDTTKYFIVSLVIQQINAELTAIADRLGGSLPKKVLCFYDELDTIAGAFGPLSQDAEFISKQLGSRTAQTGYGLK